MVTNLMKRNNQQSTKYIYCRCQDHCKFLVLTMGSRRCLILGIFFSIICPSLQQGTQHRDYCITYFARQSGEHIGRVSCDNGLTASFAHTHTLQTNTCGSVTGYNSPLWLCFYPQVRHECYGNTCDLFVTLYEARSPQCANYLYVSYECKEASNNGVSMSNGQNKQDDNTTILIAVTVVVCLLICGIIIFIGVYIYRNPKSKLPELFRASRGLRHRPNVERNVYSAPHTGVSAIDVPPPFPAPRLRDALGTVDRSITAMRLPAIPPTEVNRVIPCSAQESPVSGRPPAPLPSEISSQSRETELSRTLSVSHQVALPIPIRRYSDTEESDSDNSEDETEKNPNQRNSMVHTSPVKDRRKQFENTDHGSKTGVGADSQQLQYVAVNVLKEQPVHGTKHKDKHNDTKEIVMNKIKNNGASNIVSLEDKIPIEYAIIDKEKTLNSARNLSEETRISEDVKVTVTDDGEE